MQLDGVSVRSKRARGDGEVAPLMPRPEFSAVSVWGRSRATISRPSGPPRSARYWATQRHGATGRLDNFLCELLGTNKETRKQLDVKAGVELIRKLVTHAQDVEKQLVHLEARAKQGKLQARLLGRCVIVTG